MNSIAQRYNEIKNRVGGGNTQLVPAKGDLILPRNIPRNIPTMMDEDNDGIPDALERGHLAKRPGVSCGIQGAPRGTKVRAPDQLSPYQSDIKTYALTVGAGNGQFAALTALATFDSNDDRRFLLRSGSKQSKIDGRYCYAVQTFCEAETRLTAGELDRDRSDLSRRFFASRLHLQGLYSNGDTNLFMCDLHFPDAVPTPVILAPDQVVEVKADGWCFRLDPDGGGRMSDITLVDQNAVAATTISLKLGVKAWFADSREEALKKILYGQWDAVRQDFVLPL